MEDNNTIPEDDILYRLGILPSQKPVAEPIMNTPKRVNLRGVPLPDILYELRRRGYSGQIGAMRYVKI